jgi:hypothetical protein
MDLIDFIKLLFKKDGLNNVPNNIIKKHSFMTLRFMSIKYPVQACLMSEINADEISIAKYWNFMMVRLYNGNIPPWIYTKTAKQKKDVIDKVLEDKDIIKRFMYDNDFDENDIKFLSSMDYQGYIDELKKTESIMKKESKNYE